MNKLPVYIQSASSIHPMGNCSENKLFAQEPDYKHWITDAGLRRRMSRMVKMGVAAGLQCLQSAYTQVDAIITATGLGFLGDTEKFMQSIFEQNEELLSPTPFIQSTFNTIGGQIALISGNKSYNTTYVHRNFSFESALIDSLMQLQCGEAKNILVGAIDELTPTLFHILEKMGVYRHYCAGEGTAFFLLSTNKTTDTFAQIVAVDMQSGDYSNTTLAEKRKHFLQKNRAENARIFHEEEYKSICGEYFTAAAFGLWHACSQISENETMLVCNSFQNNHTSILIRK